MTAHFRNAEFKNGQNILARKLEGANKESWDVGVGPLWVCHAHVPQTQSS